MSLHMELKVQGADSVLQLLQSLPQEVVAKNGGPVVRGLRKGARVIQQQQIANLQSLIGASEESTGLLIKNIIVSRGKR
ncbi:hypothetical protein RZS08_03420, partial [Arthrospira platensis SPKY1]|nr:hypothetical protein [Arthrospira platensis SPKY1]